MFTRTNFLSRDKSNYAENNDADISSGGENYSGESYRSENREENVEVTFKPAYRGGEYEEEAEVLKVNNEDIDEIFIETEPK